PWRCAVLGVPILMDIAIRQDATISGYHLSVVLAKEVIEQSSALPSVPRHEGGHSAAHLDVREIGIEWREGKEPDIASGGEVDGKGRLVVQPAARRVGNLGNRKAGVSEQVRRQPEH